MQQLLAQRLRPDDGHMHPPTMYPASQLNRRTGGGQRTEAIHVGNSDFLGSYH
jgi:hypothetical protein